MNLNLKGKNAIITGGSKGIGRSIALNLAEEGTNVAICARGEEALKKTEKELLDKGVKVIALTCNVGNSEELHSFLNHVKDQFGTVDILVNNVSALSLGDDFSDWETSINVDLLGSVNATRKVIPWMLEAGSGNILFISSGSGLEAGSPPAYAAAKAAIISYSKTMAIQLAPKNIRVNTIAPGSVEFPDGLWELTKTQNPPLYNWALSSIPSGRLGTPDEIGKVATFIVSPCASWVVGTCLAVDGGQHKANL
ncbi:MAG: SDR family oxidoreductase [Flavobacteriales bacterium]|nr:SDR family oxidoreductase [Flavobacteriia bacterium]NCP53173.1 SDR family oxidoreductase [Flavobacteriales bacterium]PIV94564.1 MAG: 3-ketoacyl-ACP reductase [Flavobacteriaceae bacterium CG17_big_fil_post_rev_8_21_14_2_50_33_15]PJB17629.1 MAG: 3-ketoacyl-ACP reductase [Flavobacteriaceae bacterium CG_4_9_14_3_um_filter_33_16]NCP60330.1 SDR family oxidoreductase [Flavobacteriales bacterium]